MDQCTRRIVECGVHRGIVDGVALCRMFQRAIRGLSLPKYLSSDHDSLYRFHYTANSDVSRVPRARTPIPAAIERGRMTLHQTRSLKLLARKASQRAGCGEHNCEPRD